MFLIYSGPYPILSDPACGRPTVRFRERLYS